MKKVYFRYCLLLLNLIIISPLHAQEDSWHSFTPKTTDAYLINPGMGWQHAPDIGDPLLPSTIDYPQRGDISWNILNPERDIYNWDILDNFISDAEANHRQIGFRIYTMRGEDFGGHRLPQWVLDAGATLLESGEPDYSNCVYQDNWSHFVEELRLRYDGNPNIAFIDISGYGNFNEWSWRDDQTQWDEPWAAAYSDGNVSRETMETIDSQARRRLADMFIGGAFTEHVCRNSDNETMTVSYHYQGFQDTQLIMPFAGIVQSTQYVFSQRPDVGFRYDCLGRTDSDDYIMERLGKEIGAIWQRAPIVFEFCGSLDDNFWELSDNLLQASHASIVHDNLLDPDIRDAQEAEKLMFWVGYRYQLSSISYSTQSSRNDPLKLQMVWHNLGYAPSYPKMGQNFSLRVMLRDENGTVSKTFPLEENISEWLPANTRGDSAPDYIVNANLDISDLSIANYQILVAIADIRTGSNINLDIQNRQSDGYYPVGKFNIVD